jgi:TP901 family phage tail tape measure protein
MSGQFGVIRGELIFDVKKAINSYTAIRQEHVSTVTALNVGAGAIAGAGALVAGAGLAMAGGLIAATMAASDFERKLDFFGAVSDASVEDMEAIRAKALQLGADSIYSADQVADSFTTLAKAGVDAEDVLAGIGEAVINLGAAADIPLEQAASGLTTMLNTFNISAEDSVAVVDKLAGAANSSNIEVGDLITTMTYAGASAAILGVSFEDVNTAIAVLGEAGIKGSKAGTGLRQMFDKLAAPTKQGTEALRELGIVTDEAGNQLLTAEGKMKGLPEVLDIINGALDAKGLSAAEKIDILGRIFPITSLPTILNLLAGGSAAMRELNEEINKASAAEIASKRLDNLSGDVEYLRGELQTLMINIGAVQDGLARGLVQAIEGVVQWLNSLSPAALGVIVGLAQILSLVLIIVGVFGLFAGSILNIISLMIVLAPALSAVVGVITKLIGVMKLLWLAFMPPGAALVIGVLIAIAAALTYFFTQTEQGQALWAQFMAVMDQAIAAVIPLLTQFAGMLSGLLAAGLQIVIPLLMALGQFLMSVLAPILAIVAPALDQIAAAFSGVGTSASGLAAIGEIVSQVFDAIIAVIPIIITTLVAVLIQIVQTIVTMIPVILAAAIQMFTGIITAISTVLPQIITAVITLVTSLLTALIGMLPTLIAGAMALFQGLITALVTILPLLVMAVISLVNAIITGLIQAIPLLITAAIQLFMAIMQAIPVILPLLLTAIIELIMGLVTAVVTAIPLLLEAAIQLFTALIDALVLIIPMVITTTIELIPVIVAALISMIPVLIEGAITLFMALVEAIPQIVSALIDAIMKLGPTIVNTIISMGPQLMDAGTRIWNQLVSSIGPMIPRLVSATLNMGVQMIQGLVRGIQSMVNSVIGAVQNVVGGAIEFAKGLLNMNSPSKVFEDIGMNSILGLIVGIEGERKNLNREMAVIADDLTSFYEQVGAAAQLDAQLSVAANQSTQTTMAAPSLAAQLAALSLQLQEIAAKDTINIEEYITNNPEPEPASDTLPNNIRKAAHLVG